MYTIILAQCFLVDDEFDIRLLYHAHLDARIVTLRLIPRLAAEMVLQVLRLKYPTTTSKNLISHQSQLRFGKSPKVSSTQQMVLHQPTGFTFLNRFLTADTFIQIIGSLRQGVDTIISSFTHSQEGCILKTDIINSPSCLTTGEHPCCWIIGSEGILSLTLFGFLQLEAISSPIHALSHHQDITCSINLSCIETLTVPPSGSIRNCRRHLNRFRCFLYSFLLGSFFNNFLLGGFFNNFLLRSLFNHFLLRSLFNNFLLGSFFYNFLLRSLFNNFLLGSFFYNFLLGGLYRILSMNTVFLAKCLLVLDEFDVGLFNQTDLDAVVIAQRLIPRLASEMVFQVLRLEHPSMTSKNLVTHHTQFIFGESSQVSRTQQTMLHHPTDLVTLSFLLLTHTTCQVVGSQCEGMHTIAVGFAHSKEGSTLRNDILHSPSDLSSNG